MKLKKIQTLSGETRYQVTGWLAGRGSYRIRKNFKSLEDAKLCLIKIKASILKLKRGE